MNPPTGRCGSPQRYDEIGGAFERFKELPPAHYAKVPSLLAMVGDVRGTAVLDLASGTGFSRKEIRRRGATDVLDIDISGDMAAAAHRNPTPNAESFVLAQKPDYRFDGPSRARAASSPSRPARKPRPDRASGPRRCPIR